MNLSRRMLARYLEAGHLFSLDIELTYRCPLRCKHCYQSGRKSAEFTTDDWFRVLDEAKAMGVFHLGLTGGEVLTHKDFPELLGGAATRGFRIFVNTSGNGASTAAVEALVAARPARVDVSFYAADAASHDGLTQMPGSFAESLRFVRLLTDRGLFVQGALTPMQGVCDDPVATRDALMELGVPRIAWNRFDPTICDDPERADRLVPADGGINAIVQKLSAVGRFKVADVICGAAVFSLLVRPNGEVVPCQGYNSVAGDLSRESLSSIWSASPVLAALRTRRHSHLTDCLECPDWSSCRYCPAEAERISGDWRTPAASFCCRLAGPQRGQE